MRNRLGPPQAPSWGAEQMRLRARHRRRVPRNRWIAKPLDCISAPPGRYAESLHVRACFGRIHHRTHTPDGPRRGGGKTGASPDRPTSSSAENFLHEESDGFLRVPRPRHSDKGRRSFSSPPPGPRRPSPRCRGPEQAVLDRRPPISSPLHLSGSEKSEAKTNSKDGRSFPRCRSASIPPRFWGPPSLRPLRFVC